MDEASADQVEDLLAAVIGLPDAAQEGALTDLCGRRPELAAALRERYAAYSRLQQLTPAEQPPALGTLFGEFELQRELGRGGMGIVYLARQQRAGEERLVALKIIRDRGLMSDRAHERFRREAAASFRLDDPGLCPVFDAGEVDGVPWLAMRYVPGQTLADHIAAARGRGLLELPSPTRSDSDSNGSGAPTTTATTTPGDRFAAILTLGESLAQSLHSAHEAGFIHRDVKPSNVMVTPDGQAVLLDFGLVRGESEDQSLTVTGETLGTPAYMAPEQIDGSTPAGRASDVYSLAATLFEALTLEPPFRGRTRQELFRAILEHEVADLRRLAPGVSRDLVTVLQTALARDPGQRYSTAHEFALELGRARRNEPILARPPGVLHRLGLWSARNRLAAALVVALATALTVVAFVALEAQNQSNQATANLRAARQAVAEIVRVQQNELDGVPWLEDTRRELQQKALAFLRRFVATSSATPELLHDLAEGLVLTANLELSLGNATAAADFHHRARSALAGLDESAPNERLRGRWFEFEGKRLASRGNLTGARVAYERAIDLLTRNRSDDTDTAAVMGCLRNLAEAYDDSNDGKAALATLDRAVDLFGEVDDPESRAAVLDLASVLRKRARIHYEDGKLTLAANDCARIIMILTALLATNPHERRAVATLANTHLLNGKIHRLSSREEEWGTELLKGEASYRRLVNAFPAARVYRYQLAMALNDLATFHKRSGNLAANLEALQESRALTDALVTAEPDNVHYLMQLAMVTYNQGNGLRRAGKDGATTCFRVAYDTALGLLAIDRRDFKAHQLAARSATNMAIDRARAGDERAAALFAKARQHLDDMLELRPNDLRTASVRGVTLFNEGSFRSEHGDFEGARNRLELAFEQALHNVAATPRDLRRVTEVLVWGVRLAQTTTIAQPEKASATWQRVNDNWQAIAEPQRQRVARDRIANFDHLMLERGLAALALRAGEPEAVARLTDVLGRLTVEYDKMPSPTNEVETLICLANLIADAEASGDPARTAALREQVASRLAGWDRSLKGLSRLSNARLERVAAGLEPAVSRNPAARRRLHALLGR
ncbi:MAG: serine/threonine protein kinase [bacterium]|nr:serine/threonine protein kinase [bacterium]